MPPTDAEVRPLKWTEKNFGGYVNLDEGQLRAILRALGIPHTTDREGADLVGLLEERISSPQSFLEEPGRVCRPSPDCASAKAIFEELRAATRRRSARTAGRQTPISSAAIEPSAANAALASWRAADSDLCAAQAALVAHTNARTDLLERRRVAEDAVNREAMAAHSVLLPQRAADNDSACPLLDVLSRVDVREALLPLLTENLGVIGLWLLRPVCCALRHWATVALTSLPHIVAFGKAGCEDQWSRSLDLSTLQWKPTWGDAKHPTPLWIPDDIFNELEVPGPSKTWEFCYRGNGQVIAFAKPEVTRRSPRGYNPVKRYTCKHPRIRRWRIAHWTPGQIEWTELNRDDMIANWLIQNMVELANGRLMAVGIRGHSRSAESVVRILDADLRTWSADLPGMTVPRHDVILSRVPGTGQILAMGGFAANPWAFDPEYGGELPDSQPDRSDYAGTFSNGYMTDEDALNKASDEYEARMEGFDRDHSVTTIELWDPVTAYRGAASTTTKPAHLIGVRPG
eukprot:SAG25_NODE_1623_length_2656_cov_1.888150_2_plen_515_part_00